MYRKILRFSFVCYAWQWILFQQILKQSLNSTNTCYSNSSCVLNCENVGDKVQDLLKAVLPSKLLFDKLHNPSMQKFENRRFWTLWICLQEVRRLIYLCFLQQTGFMDMKEEKKNNPRHKPKRRITKQLDSFMKFTEIPPFARTLTAFNQKTAKYKRKKHYYQCE